MEDRRVECLVTVPPGIAVGEYANAFRVVHDQGAEWFLDFLAFSESEHTAKVVARIRVQEPFLDSIQNRLIDTMMSINEKRSRGFPITILDADGQEVIN